MPKTIGSSCTNTSDCVTDIPGAVCDDQGECACPDGTTFTSGQCGMYQTFILVNYTQMTVEWIVDI